MSNKRLSASRVGATFHQISRAQSAGLPPAETLAILARDEELPPKHAAFIADTLKVLSSGGTLADALDAYPATFRPEAGAILRAAEDDRVRASALGMIATDFEIRGAQRSGILGALTWPLTVGVILFLAVAVLMIFVVPAFKQVYVSFGADLPAPTLLMMAISDYFVAYWWMAAPVILFAAFWIWRRGFPRIRAVDAVLLRIPFLRAFLVKSFVSRLSHVLAGAARGDLPAQPAVAYLRATAGNALLADVAGEVESRLRAGKPLDVAVREAPGMPGQLVVALELGAKARSPGLAMDRVVAINEAELARSLQRLQQALLVFMYLILGLVVGFTVIAMYLPIFKLGAAI